MKEKLVILLKELAKKKYSEDIIADCILLPIRFKDKEKQMDELIQVVIDSKDEHDLQIKIGEIMREDND